MIPTAFIYWDPKPEIFTLPIVHFPILWYGVFFAIGFAVGFPIFVSLLTRFLGQEHKARAVVLTDRLTVYMIIATVAGARIGHLIFYERPASYLSDPFAIFRVWEGGLASHGAAIGIILALILFRYRICQAEPKLTLIRLLDFVAVPTAFAGFCIRLGNFMNQEILGTVTSVPWAVVFGHPADRSAPMPRHPVQLYEALIYLAIFLLLWRLSFKKKILNTEGKLIGVFLVLVFGARFIIEFFKVEQSDLLAASFLTMGQILSLPAILAGILLFFWKKLRFSA